MIKKIILTIRQKFAANSKEIEQLEKEIAQFEQEVSIMWLTNITAHNIIVLKENEIGYLKKRVVTLQDKNLYNKNKIALAKRKDNVDEKQISYLEELIYRTNNMILLYDKLIAGDYDKTNFRIQTVIRLVKKNIFIARKTSWFNKKINSIVLGNHKANRNNIRFMKKIRYMLFGNFVDEQKIATLKAQTAKLKKKYLNQEREIYNLRGRLASDSEKILVYKDKIVEAKQRIAAYKQEMADMEAEGLTDMPRYQALKKRINKNHEKIAKKNSQIADLEAKLSNDRQTQQV